VAGCAEVGLHTKSLMALAQGGAYRVVFSQLDEEEIVDRAREVMGSEELWVSRRVKVRVKKGRRRARARRMVRLNIRPMIREMSVREGALEFTVAIHDGKPGKAKEVVALFTDEPARAQITKLDTLVAMSDGLAPLSHRWEGQWSKGSCSEG